MPMVSNVFYIAFPVLLVELFLLGYRADVRAAQQREQENTLRALTALEKFSAGYCAQLVVTIEKECDTYRSPYYDSIRTDMLTTIRLTDSLSLAKSIEVITGLLDRLSKQTGPDLAEELHIAGQNIHALRNLDSDSITLHEQVIEKSCALQALYLRAGLLEAHQKRLFGQEYPIDSARIIVSESMQKWRAGDIWKGDIFLSHYKSKQPIEVTINGRTIPVIDGLAYDTLWHEPMRKIFETEILVKKPLSGKVFNYKSQFEYPTSQ